MPMMGGFNEPDPAMPHATNLTPPCPTGSPAEPTGATPPCKNPKGLHVSLSMVCCRYRQASNATPTVLTRPMTLIPVRNPTRPHLRRAIALAAALLLTPCTTATAQSRRDWSGVMDGGQTPAGTAWKKIETAHFEIVFPAELEREAQRVANTLEHVYGPVSKTLGVTPGRITVTLPNQTTVTNAGVGFLPLHAEWFSTPFQTAGALGTGEWYDLLAAHEIRHVAQIERTNTGFSHLLTKVMGDAGRAIPHLVIPGWWFEGDAVGTESALSSSGRARMPEFDMEIRTSLLSGEPVSYGTASRGTLGRWYPNEYNLGYLLTTHVKRTYGADAWSRVIGQAAAHAYNPASFSNALRSVTGRSSAEIHDDTMRELRAQWTSQLEGLAFTDARVLSAPTTKAWTSYTSPQRAGDGSLIAVKWGLDDRFHLVRIAASGKETPLHAFAPDDAFESVSGPAVSVAGAKAVWAERVPDPRWGRRDYSVVTIHDLATGRTRTLTRQSKLFSPALSPDARRVAAVEFTPERTCSLVILDAESGAELRRIASPANDFLSAPSWSDDGREIVLARQGAHGKGLALVNMETGAFRDLIAAGTENVGRPVMHGRYVYYNSPFSGIDNVYAVDVQSGQRYQVTSRRFGAFNPSVSPDGTRLLFNDYTAHGFDAADMPVEPERWVKLERVADRGIRYNDPVVAQEAGADIFSNVPSHVYPVSTYGGMPSLVSVHSWSPFAIPGDFAALSLMSTNKLNTLGATLSYDYDAAQKTSSVALTASYAGWYPIIDFGADWDGRSASSTNAAGIEIQQTWHETSLETGVRLPLDFRRGIWGQSLSLGAHAALTRVSGQATPVPFSNSNGLFVPVTYDLSVGRSTSWLRSIRPDAGQYLRLSYSHTPFGGDYRGSQLLASGGVYLPGLAKHHSTQLGVSVQHAGAGNYRFSNDVDFPRGYDAVYHGTLFAATADYALPLAYPDLDLGAFGTKRIVAHVFYDHAEGWDGASRRHQRYASLGASLIAESHLFELPFPLDVGLQYAYRLTDRGSVVRPIIRFRL